ncbi:hypothetical protein [Parvibaculum sp.]|uniref:hypothetical protein n=1 Tax=Parvibaculum sp. TaxID=2024848 RepID=UPI001DD13DDF|nr:hypothetical protein [Parvibaculum sp.]MBX3489817.1 hypothetical protein [Parvibaculum sp.]MCW5726196.1 hypothetical protein [Parvibaculum sp.]
MKLNKRLAEVILEFGNELERSAKSKLVSFETYSMQVESWFKGEIIHFLGSHSAISNLRPEYPLQSPGRKRKKVDLKFQLCMEPGPADIWIELKHWLRNYQGRTYDAQKHFRAKDWGILSEVEALSTVSDGFGYALILCTPNPGDKDWISGVASFNELRSPLMIESLTMPADFPDEFFLGLVAVLKSGLR